MQLSSTIKCPSRGYSGTEVMPADVYQLSCDCSGCGTE
jgi:hypothetical protein